MEPPAPVTSRQLLRSGAQAGALLACSARLGRDPAIARALAAPPRPPRQLPDRRPLSLVTETATSLGALESTLVTPYPVPPPPQAQPGLEPGTAPAPSGPVACLA